LPPAQNIPPHARDSAPPWSTDRTQSHPIHLLRSLPGNSPWRIAATISSIPDIHRRDGQTLPGFP
jgi:hypothetical protein